MRKNDYCHIKIRLGFTNTYLIYGKNGYLLVDAGPLNKASQFFQRLAKHGVSPDRIKLIVVTHSHWDHVGSLHDIKTVSRCPVLAHADEAFFMKNPFFKQPLIKRGGNGEDSRTSPGNLRQLEKKYRFKPVEPDILIDNDTDLDYLGFAARLLPTPGHTPGSLSMITADGEAFVGDLAINTFPFGPGPGFPQYAHDHLELEDSWEKLLLSGAKTIFPAHGRPFKMDGKWRGAAGDLFESVFAKKDM